MAKRAPYHHGDLRHAMLEAVGLILREHGLRGLSLREASRRARVSHTAPAHHFGNKAGLLTAYAAQGYARLAEAVVSEVMASSPADSRRELEAIGRGYVRFALAHPEQFGVMFRLELLDEHDPAFMQASDAAYGLLLATVQRCADEGHIARERSELAAVACWSLVHGLATLWLSRRLGERTGERDPHRLARAVGELVVRALMG